MRRGSSLKTEGIGGNMNQDRCRPIPNYGNDFKVTSSEVIQKQNLAAINQTSSVERSRGASSGRRSSRRSDHITQGEKMPCCEGQQNYSQMRQSKDNGPHDRERSKVRRSRNVPTKSADETVDKPNNCNKQRPPKSSLPPNASFPRAYSNKQTQGNQNTSRSRSNSKTQSQEQSILGPNQTLKVANLETLVIQPGSPTVIEVRSGARQNKCTPNESDTNVSEVDSSFECGPMNDIGDGPSLVNGKSENSCDSKGNDPNKCQPTVQEKPNTCKGSKGSRRDCNTNLPLNADSPKLSERTCGKNTKTNGKSCMPSRRMSTDQDNRKQSISSQASHTNGARDCNMYASPTTNGSENKTMLCSSNRIIKSNGNTNDCSSNGQKQSNSADTANCGNAVDSKEPIKTLTVSNLDTLVIQPGSPTLIQLRQIKGSKDVKEDCEQEQNLDKKNQNECEANSDLIPDGGGELLKCQEYTNVNECLNATKNACSEKQSKTKKGNGPKTNSNSCSNDQLQEQPQYTQCQTSAEYQTQMMGFSNGDQRVQCGRTSQKSCNNGNYSNSRQKVQIPTMASLAPQQQYQTVGPCQMAATYLNQYQPSPQTEYQYSSQLVPQGQMNSRVMYPQFSSFQHQNSQYQAVPQMYQYPTIAPQLMTKPVHAYNEAQYQPGQQFVTDYMQIQPMYDQSIPAQYQNQTQNEFDNGYGNEYQCDNSNFSDTQFSEDYNVPDNYSDQQPTQFNAEANTPTNMYYQGNQNYPASNYYNCCAYE